MTAWNHDKKDEPKVIPVEPEEREDYLEELEVLQEWGAPHNGVPHWSDFPKYRAVSERA